MIYPETIFCRKCAGQRYVLTPGPVGAFGNQTTVREPCPKCLGTGLKRE